ncbi:Alpha-galactosidase [Leclercia adecarboxylata]|uniref:Alpha-galactosidase n=1 Tax=Leclercia adecarboxylata TaxID=83655 RepID=A0A4V6JM98_9ENTR|nr:Alpha-galactosidase [Leclercia adecarboxylata]
MDRHAFTPATPPQGLNGMSQQFHRYLRDNIIRFPENKPRPVHLNTWEGIYFNHDPEYIMRMADEAALAGRGALYHR